MVPEPAGRAGENAVSDKIMSRPRFRALTSASVFQVPLEGTVLTLGIAGVVFGAVILFLFDAIGLTAEPGLGSLRPPLLDRLEPGGVAFTYWCWTPAVNGVATLLVELGLWSLFGVAIARTVISRVSEDEPMGVRTALSFAVSCLGRSWAYVGLFTSVMLLLSLPFLLPTLLGALPGVGPVLGPVTYVVISPLLILLAMFAVVTLLAAFPVGYFFFPAALAAREGPFLDCVAKALGYAFARPFLCVWNLFKMAVFAYALFYLGTRILPAVVRDMPTLYGLFPSSTHPAAGSDLAATAERIIRIVLRLITGGFVVAYLFSAGTLIYLNLRLEVDGIAFTGPTPEDPEPGAEA